ncbi:MAG: hypothetical protein V2A74_12725, partial [bacterium]
MSRHFHLCFVILALACLQSGWGAAILFDNTKNEGPPSGDYDFVIDDDAPLPQPESPSAADDWVGALSSFAYELLQQGHSVQTLPPGALLTFHDSLNSQDLEQYDIFVVPGPRAYFTAEEKAALVEFVRAGHGLLILSDFDGSDPSSQETFPSDVWNDAGVGENFGFEFTRTVLSGFSDNKNGAHPIVQDSRFGPVGGVVFHGGDVMRLTQGANASVAGLFWLQETAQNDKNLMAVASQVGNGRVVAFGDVSALDDGSGAAGKVHFANWDDPGASHRAFFLAAVEWLAGASSANAAPTYERAQRIPKLPTEEASVEIRASLQDQTAPVREVLLHFRFNDTSAYTSQPLQLSEGNRSSGLWVSDPPIPAAAPGTRVEYYLSAADDGNPALTSFFPAGAPNQPASYQVAEKDGSLDISGWTIVQRFFDQSFTIPAGTVLSPGNYVIVARMSTQPNFEAFWKTSLGGNVIYFDSSQFAAVFPQINGEEVYEIRDASGQVADGPTVPLMQGMNSQRIAPGLPPEDPNSWI